MWWFKRHLLIPLALAAALALAGCGFRPVYGKYAVDPDIRKELDSIAIATINTRQGQLVRNALLNRINPNGEPSRPVYNLVATMIITEGQQALRTDDTATRDQVTYSISYKLLFKEGIVTSGILSKSLSYDFLQENYANISAQTNTDQRAAEQIAEEIQYRLAGYFAQALKAKNKKP